MVNQLSKYTKKSLSVDSTQCNLKVLPNEELKSSDTLSFIIASNPIYNETRTKLILNIDAHCGSLCGTGYIYILTKENGKWIPQKGVMSWIS